LGKLGKGVPKTFTPEQLRRLTERLSAARAKRWAGHETKAQKETRIAKASGIKQEGQ
jgi:hypothetical protein